ncbi:DUF3450 family protein [Methylomonas sp. MgM2]
MFVWKTVRFLSALLIAADRPDTFTLFSNMEFKLELRNLYSFNTRRLIWAYLLIAWPALVFAAPPSQKTAKPDSTSSASNSDSADKTVTLEAEQLLDQQLNRLFDYSVAALKRYIGTSSPFMLSERQARIERLEKLPATSDINQAEKYRRLLESYRIELDFGKTIETYQAELDINGQKRLVDFLRIGQLALYYQTFDGAESGIWSRAQVKWLPLSETANARIAKGLRIARKIEPPQLMELPLFGVEKSEDFSLPELEAVPEKTLAAFDAALASKTTLISGIRENAANLKIFYQQQTPDSEYAKQIKLLDTLIDNRHTPNANELRQLLIGLLHRLDIQRRVSVFDAQVYAPNGLPADKSVLSIGGFSLIADGLYLTHSGEDNRLVELSRQPSAEILELAKMFPTVDSGSLATLAVDPSGGQILQLLVQAPNFKERIGQGGPVGYLILSLGLLALLLSIYRFAKLTLISRRIETQLHTQGFLADNPLGRLLEKLHQSTLNDEEALYLIVDESLTIEQTQLEQGLAFLKLVAAIAPMLGLLGTVTGMIETFQAIALHGSGDPKLMSGGISEALVTTVEGLVTAIPILLLHSLLAGKSQALAAILEAHISVALAHRLERRTTASDAGVDIAAA